jgi:hypothetical protein
MRNIGFLLIWRSLRFGASESSFQLPCHGLDFKSNNQFEFAIRAFYAAPVLDATRLEVAQAFYPEDDEGQPAPMKAQPRRTVGPSFVADLRIGSVFGKR